MKAKAVFGIVGMLLMAGFLGSIMIKIKSISLTIVVLIGLVMMAVDFWQSLKERED
jgi:predicted tellurium resistance membrane protein TerC